jgi:hypothetical protein
MLLAHFEKLALAIAGACLASVALGAARTPDEVASSRTLARELAEIGERSKPPSAAPAPPPDWVDRLRAQVEPGRVPQVDRFPGWLSHRRPTLVVYMPPDPRPVASVGAPHGLAGEVRHGAVRLAWEAGEVTGATIESFRIERREPSDAAWTKVAEILREPDQLAPATGYEDKTVRPRVRYDYRVIQHVWIDDGSWRAGAGTWRDQSVAWTAPVPVLRDVRIVAVHGSLQTGPGSPATVALRVYRWVEDLGGWVGKTYSNVAIDRDVGAEDVVKGRRFDFRSGARLVDAREEDRRGPGLPRRTVAVLRWEGVAEPEEADDVAPPEVTPVLWVR